MAVRNYAGFDARARGHPNHWPILRSSTSQRGMDPSPRPLWGEGGERSEPGEGLGHFRSADETSGAKFPDRAALVLGNDPKSGEDGLLQVREIRDLNLAADLVTLSACDTGVGALEGEESIANLVRAFLFAGAKSVVASLWAASDVYTLNLMEHFYRYIAAGEDKGSALRHAQMDLIKQFADRRPCHSTGRASSWSATGLGAFGFQ